MSKDNNFLKGAAILSIAGVIIKILGAVYRIPLSNIIGDEGMGYFQTAYPFYQLLLTLSTAGFPVAIAKLVSTKRAIGDHRNAYKVFKVALLGLFLGGILTSLFVAIGARPIVESLGNSYAYYSLIALIPALLFVPIMAAFRGFFQGRKTMAPTAISQIVEQLFRVIFGLSLTILLINKGTPIAAGGASFGGSAGAIVGTIIMIYIFMKSRNELHNEINSSTINKEYPVSRIIKDLLMIAIPITIGSSIAPIMDTIDTGLVLNRLQSINYTESQANALFGQLKGMAQTLINLPQVFSVAIAMSLVPSISDAHARNKKNEIKDTISSGVRITLLIGLPCAFGLFVLSTPIIGLLYFKNPAETINSIGEILAYLSFGVIFLTLVQTLTAILQGLGKPFMPVKNLALGALVKIILTYFLTAIPAINIKGAAISTVSAYAIAAILDFVDVARLTKIKFNYFNIITKPLISAAGMAIVARLGFVLLGNIVGNMLVTLLGEQFTFMKLDINILGNMIATLLAVLLGVLFYAVLLIVTGSITSDDLALIPKGERIAEKLERFKIFK